MSKAKSRGSTLGTERNNKNARHIKLLPLFGTKKRANKDDGARLDGGINSHDGLRKTDRTNKVKRAKSAADDEQSAFQNNKKRSRNMAGKIFKKIYSRADKQIFVKGKNAYKALVAASKLYRLENVEIVDGGVRFCVGAKDCDKVIAILSNLCYNYKIIRYKGVAANVAAAVSRAGVVLGLCLAAILIAIYPFFITRIDVSGAGDSALKGKIFDILASRGIVKGAFVSQIDYQSLEKDLLALDRVAYAGVRRSGTHLAIMIKEELAPESFIGIKGAKVKSTALATVTRVVVNQGTALVSYGDVVKPDDVLIDGYVLYGDSPVEVEASGVVYGKTLRKKTVFFDDVKAVKRAVKTKTITKLSFFGMPVKAPPKPFENCVEELTVSRLGFLLPIKIYSYRFTEYVFDSVKNEMTEDEMAAEVYSSILSEMTSSAASIKKYVSFDRAQNGVYVSVTVEAEEIISAIEAKE